MAFALLSYECKFWFLFVFAISFVSAEFKPSWNELASPFVLVRLKRSPQRAFTFSGFNPNNGLAAFATSSDFLSSYYAYPQSVQPQPYRYRAEGRGETFLPASSNYPPSSDYTSINSPSTVAREPEYNPHTDYQPNTEEPTSANIDEERKIPSQSLTPPNDYAPGTGYGVNSSQVPKKPKKKPNYPTTPVHDDDEEDDSGKTKSSSSASFNAWFPIVLGMYPTGGKSESHKENSSWAPLKEGNSERGGLGNTVIANSVSHGRSSVASSHAIAYGGDGPAPMQSYRKG